MVPESYEHEFVSFIERNSNGGIAFLMAPRLSQGDDHGPSRQTTDLQALSSIEETLWLRHDEEISQIESDPDSFPEGGESSAADLREQARYDLDMEFGAKINWNREHALTKRRGGKH